MNEIPLNFFIILLVVLILLSAFFAGSETALMSLNRYRLRHLAKGGHRGAQFAERLLKRPDRLIGMILLGNIAVHSAASNIGYVTLALPPDDRRRANYNPKSGSNDFAHVALDTSGRIRVQIGTAGAGQGHATTAAQIAARELGVRVEDVDVIDVIDTDTTPWTITTGSYASRFSVVVTAAVQRASGRLNAHLRSAGQSLCGRIGRIVQIPDGSLNRLARLVLYFLSAGQHVRDGHGRDAGPGGDIADRHCRTGSARHAAAHFLTTTTI